LFNFFLSGGQKKFQDEYWKFHQRNEANVKKRIGENSANFLQELEEKIEGISVPQEEEELLDNFEKIYLSTFRKLFVETLQEFSDSTPYVEEEQRLAVIYIFLIL
jgi:hypothetical protein